MPHRTARPATLSDEGTLVEGNLKLALETENHALEADVVRAGVRSVLTRDVGATYFLVDDPETGIPAGQLMVTREWSDWRNCHVWWIHSVYVWPEARRTGVYTTLYQFVCDAAREAGAGGVRLYVDNRNTQAQQTYRNLGMNGDHYTVFESIFGSECIEGGL